MKLEDVVARNEKLIVDNVENEIIIFNEETQNTHILNESAGYLFYHAEKSKIADIIDEFYNVLTDEEKSVHLKEEVVQDCIAILEEMISQGLLLLMK